MLAAASARARHPAWIVFGSALGLIVGNVTVLQFSASVMMKPITAEFGWQRGVMSTAILLAMLCAALATPLVGRLVDRRGLRPVTLAAITLFALSLGAMSFVPASPVAFVAMYAIVGIFSAGQAPLPYAKSISAAFDRRRGLALGVAMTGVGLGAALVPRLTQAYLEHFGWRGAFAAMGITVFVIAFPAVALFVTEPVVDAGTRTESALALSGATAREALRERSFWILAAVFLALPIVANGVIAHLVPLLTDRGLSPHAAVSIFGGIGASLIAGRLVCGWLLDRFFAPHVAIAFVAVPAVGVVTLLLATGAVSTAIGAVFVGIGLGAEVDLIGYLQSRYLGLRSFGQIYGVLFAIFTFGTGVGPFAMGAAFDASGSYRPALAGFLVVLFAAAVLLLQLPRHYRFGVRANGALSH